MWAIIIDQSIDRPPAHLRSPVKALSGLHREEICSAAGGAARAETGPVTGVQYKTSRGTRSFCVSTIQQQLLLLLIQYSIYDCLHKKISYKLVKDMSEIRIQSTDKKRYPVCI